MPTWGWAATLSAQDTAALKAIHTVNAGISDGDIAVVASRLSLDDGGGGVFRYDANISTYEDGGIYFEPNNLSSSANGRWVRVYDNHVNVMWYGAAKDGTTDDFDEIQDANDAASTLELPLMLPEGTYAIDLQSSTPLEPTTSWYSKGGATLKNTNLGLGGGGTSLIVVDEQDGLTFSQIHLDGQITTEGSSTPNLDLTTTTDSSVNDLHAMRWLGNPFQ